MSARSPDLSSTADTVPGRRGALTATPSQAVPATNSPTGGKLPLSATERTRHRRFRHLGRVDRDCLYAVLEAGLVAHLGVITGGWPMVVPTVYGYDPAWERCSLVPLHAGHSHTSHTGGTLSI